MGAVAGLGAGQIRLPALVGLAIMGAFLLSYLLGPLYGGSMLHSDGRQPLVLGINIGVAGFGLASLVSLVALALSGGDHSKRRCITIRPESRVGQPGTPGASPVLLPDWPLALAGPGTWRARACLALTRPGCAVRAGRGRMGSLAGRAFRIIGRDQRSFRCL